MIVPMKKIAVLVQSKDADSTLKTLASLGVLHVIHRKPPQGKDISAIEDDIDLTDKAINILKTAESDNKKNKPGSTWSKPDNWKSKAQHIIDLQDRLSRLEEYGRVAKNEITEWQSWGNFDPEEIKTLAEKNIYLRLYRVPVKKIKDFPPSAIVKKLSVKKGIANCAVISRDKSETSFKEVPLPKMGIERMQTRLSKDQKVIESIKNDMQKHLSCIGDFSAAKKTLQKELEFQEALSGMGESGSIAYLTGFAPDDKVEALLKMSKKEKWGITTSDPSPEERVPTLIRNPKWISIIAPVFKVLEIVPGYKELDISLWFLVFLSIFFGMLIGDAAYGIIFFALTLIAQKKLGKKVPNKAGFILLYVFSSCAIIWGVLTGTFFGQAWLPESIKPLMPILRNSKNMQSLCFLIGVIHLTIGHLWRAILKAPSPKALSDMGWVSVLWGAFFLAKTLILGESFPQFAKWFFIVGPILVVLFTDLNLNRHILKGIGSGLGNLLLNFVNSFTDVVSYIRLFAVGLATVAIADAFNKMAMGIGFNSILTGLATALILLLGHTLNIILGPLAVLVHGVRLNVLEFCNHVDIRWSGFSYKPLREE